MKRLLLALILLSACSPNQSNTSETQSNVIEKNFEPFSWVSSESYYCALMPEGFETEGKSRDEIELMFVTLFDHVDNEARVKFDGDVLRLLPVEDIGTLPAPRDTLYSVVGRDDLKVQVTLTSSGTSAETNHESEKFFGEISMIGAGASAPVMVEGSCGL